MMKEQRRRSKNGECNEKWQKIQFAKESEENETKRIVTNFLFHDEKRERKN